MPRNNIKNDLKTCIELGVPEQSLVLPIAIDQFSARYSGVSYYEYSTNTDIIVKVWNKVIDDFDLDWAGVFIDDLFEYEPLGIELARPKNLPFAVSRYLPPLVDTLNNLRIPDPLKDGRMPVRLEANMRLKEKWGDRILINCNIAAPFTGLTLLYGIDEGMLLLHDDPDLLHKTMNFLEELAITWGKALIKNGTDIIWLGECIGSSRFVSRDIYREYALRPAKRVVNALKNEGATVIYHACEKEISYLYSMLEVGADILTIASNTDIVKVKNELGGCTCLMGNLDPINLICNGTLEEIENEIRKLAVEVHSKGGFIINTEEGIPEQTSVENLATFSKSIRNAGNTDSFFKSSGR